MHNCGLTVLENLQLLTRAENAVKGTFRSCARHVFRELFMKKIVLLIVVFLFGYCCFAQDVIVTKDGKKINAIVSEIELEVVKYKHFDNQNGPTISIRKSDISTIIYQNGQIEIFEQKRQEPPKYIETQMKSYAKKGYEMSFEYGNYFQIPGITTFSILNLACGYRFNNHLFLGGGTGIDHSRWRETFLWLNRPVSRWHIPIFLRVKANFLSEKKVNPFFLFNFGYEFMLIYESTARSYREACIKRDGVIINPCFGIDLNFRNRTGIFICAGYHVHINDKSNYFYSRGAIHSLCLKVGFKFQP